MNMARYEQETIINFNEEEKTAGIYTHNKALRQKLAALARDRPEDCRLPQRTGS
jgi:IS1 family transposase